MLPPVKYSPCWLTPNMWLHATHGRRHDLVGCLGVLMVSVGFIGNVVYRISDHRA